MCGGGGGGCGGGGGGGGGADPSDNSSFFADHSCRRRPSSLNCCISFITCNTFKFKNKKDSSKASLIKYK